MGACCSGVSDATPRKKLDGVARRWSAIAHPEESELSSADDTLKIVSRLQFELREQGGGVGRITVDLEELSAIRTAVKGYTGQQRQLFMKDALADALHKNEHTVGLSSGVKDFFSQEYNIGQRDARLRKAILAVRAMSAMKSAGNKMARLRLSVQAMKAERNSIHSNNPLLRGAGDLGEGALTDGETGDADDDADALAMTQVRALRTVSFTTDGEKQAGTLLARLDDWSFDVFQLGTVCTSPLKFAAYGIFAKYSFDSDFGLDKHTLERFLVAVESGYCAANSYHNSLHATDVLQTMHFFLHKGVGKRISAVEQFASLLAAMAHDIGHQVRRPPSKGAREGGRSERVRGCVSSGTISPTPRPATHDTQHTNAH